jgi:hypothetical protein
MMILPRRCGLPATLVTPNDIVFSTSGLFDRQKQIFNPRVIIHFFSMNEKANMRLYVYSVFIELLDYFPPQDRTHDRRHDLADSLRIRHLFCLPKIKKS